jgi:hypothetical protein
MYCPIVAASVAGNHVRDAAWRLDPGMLGNQEPNPVASPGHKIDVTRSIRLKSRHGSWGRGTFSHPTPQSIPGQSNGRSISDGSVRPINGRTGPRQGIKVVPDGMIAAKMTAQPFAK